MVCFWIEELLNTRESLTYIKKDKETRRYGRPAGNPYLDFGARVYDPRTAAWLSQDPLSEKYYSISPYAYCAGNPVLVFDPDGRQLYVAKEYQEQFRMDLQNVFGEKTEAFYFNDDGALKLDCTKKDFLSGMTKDQSNE